LVGDRCVEDGYPGRVTTRTKTQNIALGRIEAAAERRLRARWSISAERRFGGRAWLPPGADLCATYPAV